MAKIGIIGHGFVGEATEYGFRRNGNQIFIHDKFKNSLSLAEVVLKSDFIFICVPTPYKKNRIDLSIMDEVMAKVAKLTEETGKIVIIKSTVIPGTTKNYQKKYRGINLCFNPEFLREANHLKDFMKTDRLIIGASDNFTKFKVTNLYKKILPKTPIFCTDTVSAEMVKYMANTFLATKVIFANEMFELCKKLRINYDEVKKMVGADRRIGQSHFDITKERGFGGKCFPKDLVALIGLFEDLGIDASLLKTVWRKNLKIRKVKDWEKIPFVKTG